MASAERAKRASSTDRRDQWVVSKKTVKIFWCRLISFDSFHDTSVKLIETGAWPEPCPVVSFGNDSPDEVSFLGCIKKLVEIEESPANAQTFLETRRRAQYVQFVLSTMYFT